MSGQPYTKINNTLLNALCKLQLSGQELRVLLFIIRYTKGFNRNTAELSITFIANGTESNVRTVQRTLNKLAALGYISISHTKGTKPRLITIRDGQITTPRGGEMTAPRGGQMTTQEIKENKENAPGLSPDGLTQREKEILAALNAEWVPNEF